MAHVPRVAARTWPHTHTPREARGEGLGRPPGLRKLGQRTPGRHLGHFCLNRYPEPMLSRGSPCLVQFHSVSQHNEACVASVLVVLVFLLLFLPVTPLKQRRTQSPHMEIQVTTPTPARTPW